MWCVDMGEGSGGVRCVEDGRRVYRGGERGRVGVVGGGEWVCVGQRTI